MLFNMPIEAIVSPGYISRFMDEFMLLSIPIEIDNDCPEYFPALNKSMR